MGVYDRDYYRESDRGLLASIVPEGSVCKILIAIQVIVFAAQALAVSSENGRDFTQWLGLQPSALMVGEIWRVFTFGFAHPSLNLWTLVFSLLFLWWFGSDLEQMYGSGEFLCFYLATILIGGTAFVVVAFLIDQPNSTLLGALGPVTAVTVLFAWHFPNFTIRLFFFIPVPLWAIVVLEIAGALFLARQQAAYVLAGAFFGTLYYKKQWRLSSLFQGWGSRPRTRAKLRVYRPEDDAEPVAVAAPKPATPVLDEHLEAKVDAVLEKMAHGGMQSLSDSDRQILLRASELYRRKRT